MRILRIMLHLLGSETPVSSTTGSETTTRAAAAEEKAATEAPPTSPLAEEVRGALGGDWEDREEELKQRQLAEARKLLAARRFEDAMIALAGVREAHPKDSGIIKLHSLVLQEKEKQAGIERLQKELSAMKQLVSEKKYAEVLARSERIQKEFPGNTDLTRLLEFSRIQQSQIERESQQQKILQEVKKLFDSAHYEEAFQVALAGLKTFPENQELQFLREQSDTKQRKLETRQHIEQTIREIKVKINRGKISEAIDLANQTLIKVGPDTDVTQLLNSAQVEHEARKKKESQQEKIETIRALIGSGKLVDATRALDEAVEEKLLEVFDPRVQRVCEELEQARSAAFAAGATGIATPNVGLSKEYAWLQSPPANMGSGSTVERGQTNLGSTNQETTKPLNLEQNSPIAGIRWQEEQPQFMAAVEKSVAAFLGPIARILVHKAASKAKDPREMLAILASTLPSEDDRRAFLARKNELLHSVVQARSIQDLPLTQTQLGTNVLQTPPRAAVPAELTPDAVRRAAELLARNLGPISRILADRAAQRADSLQSFYLLLADHLEDRNERAKFLFDAGFPEV